MLTQPEWGVKQIPTWILYQGTLYYNDYIITHMLTSRRKSRFMFLTSFKFLMLEQGWGLTVPISPAIRVFGAAMLKYLSAHLSFSLRHELNMDGTEESEATWDQRATLQVITFKQLCNKSREGEMEFIPFHLVSTNTCSILSLYKFFYEI